MNAPCLPHPGRSETIRIMPFSTDPKARVVQVVLMGVFAALAAGFVMDLRRGRPALPPIPLVDPAFTVPEPVRVSIAEQVRQGADSDDWDCYICHEEDTPPPLHFDDEHDVIVAEEHSDIVMGHGRHKRNNNCFNCHDEQNLRMLQTKDGRELPLAQSSPLCGSCHGPIYRDWEGGAHGRAQGYWNEALGERVRLDCVSCHNPHSPPFPKRALAPGPHPLHSLGEMAPATGPSPEGTH